MPRFTLTLLVSLAILASRGAATRAADPAVTGAEIGAPVAIEIQPQSIALNGPRAGQQLIVTARYADGSRRDVTRVSAWQRVDPQLMHITSRGWVTARGDGATQLTVAVGGLQAQLPVTVRNAQRAEPISFRREVVPVLSAAGCSDIRCHGAPSGKNGFRLSLWGFDPQSDYRQLARDAFGRRTNAIDPDTSLILLKPLARVSHIGGRRFQADSPWAEILRRWQSEGLRDDPQRGGLQSLTAVPSVRVLHAPARRQQLAVYAAYEDGQTRDVTRLTQFTASDLAVADIDRTGLVEFKAQGETAVLCRFQGEMTSVRLTHIAAPPADYRWPNPPQNNTLDRHVFAKLALLNVRPSELCNDEAFVRRVHLDLCGRLPTRWETERFLAATQPDRRARLIDRLLQRPEYADYWTKKWMDVLRVSRDSIQLAGAQAYQRWLRGLIASDASFAQIVHSLLTSQGESYRDPATNFFCVVPTPTKVTDAHYLPKDLAESTAQLFLGVRLQCAQCHNHPYERWTRDDYLALAAFFTQVKRSRLGKAGPSGRPDRRQMAITVELESPELTGFHEGETVTPHFPGQRGSSPAKGDRREVLASWLTGPANPFFAKAVVNRLWFHLHGRGIVEPVDDFRDSNPASNDALLESLAEQLVRHGFRLTPLIRAIVSSRTYQLAATPNASNRHDDRYFSHMLARPLPAEVLLDAICDVTDVPERYVIMQDYTIGIPTEKVHLRTGTRAVQLPVNDIVTLINTSGKYVRYESHPFLRTFGQPNRTQTCECDREQAFGRKQALELIVGPMVTRKLADPNNRLGPLLARETAAAEILESLYLRALSRVPTPGAAKALLEHVATSVDKRSAWEDVLWTVLNSQEFVYQH